MTSKRRALVTLWVALLIVSMSLSLDVRHAGVIYGTRPWTGTVHLQSSTQSNSGSGVRPLIFPQGAVTGEQTVIMILVEFTDVKHSTREEDVGEKLSELNEYWSEVSYGKISLSGFTTRWYTLRNNLEYYGADKGSETDPNGWRLIVDSVSVADRDVDFSMYKQVIIVHAGKDQTDSGKGGDLWPAHWILSSEDWISTNDGTKVSHAIYVSEYALLGTYAHEFGHSLGLPDLYDVSHKEVFVGPWSLMDSGDELGDPEGSSPGGLEAWSRIELGWISPIALFPTSSGVSQMVYPLEENAGPRAVRVPITSRTYYLIEVRQKTGLDSSLPEEGVLITRIDASKESGEGIVKVMDRDPSTRTLSDAAFTVGDEFKDGNNEIYITVLSVEKSVYSLVVASRPSAVITPKLSLSDMIGQHSGRMSLNTLAVGSYGEPISGITLIFEYERDGVWTQIGSSTTNTTGFATVVFGLTMPPGRYVVKCSSTGGSAGGHFFFAADTSAILNVDLGRPTVKHNIPHAVTAYDIVLCQIRILQGDESPLPEASVRVYMDGILHENLTTDSGGYAETTFSYDLTRIGRHLVGIQVECGGYFSKFEETIELQVNPPIWLYFLLILPILLVGAVGYRMRRREPKFSGLTVLPPTPATLEAAPMNEQRYCERCGSRMSPRDRYCSACGQAQW